MDANAVNMYIAAHASEFPAQSLEIVRQKLLSIPADNAIFVNTVMLKNPVIAFILSFFLGWFGIDRFYIGDILMGILKLITGGGFGIWWFVDLFLIMGATRRKNLMTILSLR